MCRTIQVPAPMFELYESVTLRWNGIEYQTRIVECSFRLSAQEWVYQVAQVSNELDEERFFAESVFESR
jgi:hypothetical protein